MKLDEILRKGLRENCHIRRRSWFKEDILVYEYNVETDDTFMYRKTVNGELHDLSYRDITADDWEVITIRKEKSDKCYFDFSKALVHLKQGYKLSRSGWNSRGMWVQIQIPDHMSKMTLPYFFIMIPAYPDGSKVPWVPSITDLMAEDWFIVI